MIDRIALYMWVSRTLESWHRTKHSAKWFHNFVAVGSGTTSLSALQKHSKEKKNRSWLYQLYELEESIWDSSMILRYAVFHVLIFCRFYSFFNIWKTCFCLIFVADECRHHSSHGSFDNNRWSAYSQIGWKLEEINQILLR